MSARKPKTCYDYNRLKQYCDENNIVLTKDYSKEKINRETIIEADCLNCSGDVKKTFRMLERTGCFCDKCKKQYSEEKKKATCLKNYGVENPKKNQRTRWNINKLNKFCIENNVMLLRDYTNERITCDLILEGHCSNIKCNLLFKKSFKHLISHGDKCSHCCIGDNSDFKIYNWNLLIEYCNKYNITLLEDYSKLKLCRNSIINTKCLNCKNSCEKSFYSLIKSGSFCHKHANDIKMNKTRYTNMNKYGFDYALQSTTVKEKSKNTNREKYGCECPLQNEGVKEKIKETNREKYGCEYPMQNEEVKEKSQSTNIKKYGFSNPFQNEDIKEKIKTTNREKYGCENPMQNAEIFEKQQKAGFKRKEYTFPSGRVESVQGYEPQALDYFITNGGNEDDIITDTDEMGSRCGKIFYHFEDGRHRYYPDLYQISTHKIIEVKSIWTFEIEKEKNLKKREACINAGINFEFWIMEKNGNLLEII